MPVIEDPLSHTELDDRYYEDRFVVMGDLLGTTVIVVYALPIDDSPNAKGRIMSARKAESKEKRNYENNAQFSGD